MRTGVDNRLALVLLLRLPFPLASFLLYMYCVLLDSGCTCLGARNTDAGPMLVEGRAALLTQLFMRRIRLTDSGKEIHSALVRQEIPEPHEFRMQAAGGRRDQSIFVLQVVEAVARHLALGSVDEHAIGVLSMPKRSMATDVVAGAVELMDHDDVYDQVSLVGDVGEEQRGVVERHDGRHGSRGRLVVSRGWRRRSGAWCEIPQRERSPPPRLRGAYVPHTSCRCAVCKCASDGRQLCICESAARMVMGVENTGNHGAKCNVGFIVKVSERLALRKRVWP